MYKCIYPCFYKTQTKFQNFNQNNLTITFSGYNIKENIKLSIESFLYFHPEYKKCIVVFDDNSTDGTKEWLEKNNIKRISWSDKYIDMILKYKNCKEYGKCTRYWNDIMVCDIMEQIKTKYLIINDGDVIFLNKFLDKYLKLLKNDYYKGLFVIGTYHDVMFNNKQFLKYYQKYKILHKQNRYLERVHIYHGLFNLRYFKNINLLFDDIYDKLYVDSLIKYGDYSKHTNEYGMFADGGVDFLYKLYEKKILFYPLLYVYNEPHLDYIYHFGYKSSIKKLQDTSLNKYSSLKNFYNKKLILDRKKLPKLDKMLNYFNL